MKDTAKRIEELQSIRSKAATEETVAQLKAFAKSARQEELFELAYEADIIRGGKLSIIGRHDESIALLKGVLKEAEQKKITKIISLANLNLANAYSYSGAFYESAQQCDKTIAFQRANELYTHLCYTYTTLSAIYIQLDYLYKAIQNLNNLLEINRIHGNDVSVTAPAYGNLLECYAKMGDTQSIDKTLALAEKYYRESKKPMCAAKHLVLCYSIAHHFKQGNQAKAKELSEIGLELFDVYTSYYNRADFLIYAWPTLCATQPQKVLTTLFDTCIHQLERRDENDLLLRVLEAFGQYLHKSNQVEELARLWPKLNAVKEKEKWHIANLKIAFEKRSEAHASALLHNATLKAQNEELRVINHGLNRFSHMVSHDIRSPLRNIMSMSQIMLNKLQEDEQNELKNYLSYLIDSSQHLKNLVEALLDFARAGQKVEKKEVVALSYPVKKAIENLQNAIQGKNATVAFELKSKVEGDQTLLIVLFQNLIENAIKYNDAYSAQIKIYEETSTHGLTVSIEDNGMGFDPDTIDLIFEPFSRFSKDRSISGLGIGLATCKKIVEAHHGKLTVKNKADKGSILYIYFPNEVLS